MLESRMRHALRALWREPLHSAAVILIITLGLGVNIALLSIIDTALLRPLPFPEGDRLMVLRSIHPRQSPSPGPVSRPDYLDWLARAPWIEAAAVYAPASVTVGTGRQLEQVDGARVTPSFFSLLGATPTLGRFFSPDEDTPTTGRVAVVSDRLWQRSFMGSQDAIGGQITVNGEPFTVIGVMGAGFTFPRECQIWIPSTTGFADVTNRLYRIYGTVLGRLRPSTRTDDAASGFSKLAEQLERENPNTNRGWKIHMVSLREYSAGPIRPALFLLTGAVMLVLIVAVSNLAHLQLARALRRQRDAAIRLALGAGMRHLVRQCVVEALTLALLSGCVAILAACITLPGVVTALALRTPLAIQPSYDLRFMILGFGFSVVIGLVMAIFPLGRLRKLDLNPVLKDSSSSVAREGSARALWVQRSLVIIQVSMSMALLVGCTLLVKSVIRLSSVDPGFHSKGIVTAKIRLPRAKYRAPSQRAAFFSEALTTVRQLPGIRNAGLAVTAPMTGAVITQSLTREDQPADVEHTREVLFNFISSGYLETLGLTVKHGRTLTEQDAFDTTNAVVVNAVFSRRFFPEGNPVGKRLRLGPSSGNATPLLIVGVVSDIRQQSLGVDAEPEVYQPFYALPPPYMTLVANSSLPSGSASSTIQQAIVRLDPEVTIQDVRPMEEVLAKEIAPKRAYMVVLNSLGMVAALLALIGVYGLTSYVAIQRRREMALRMTLGANTRDIAYLMGRWAALLVLPGIVIGSLIASIGTKYLQSQLYGVQPLDPMSFALSALMLLVASVVAVSVPIWQATMVEPLTVIRSE